MTVQNSWRATSAGVVRTVLQANLDSGADLGASGWIESVEDRAPGVASVSAPVLDRAGTIVAAISVSGPIDRIGRSPGKRHGAEVVAAARALEALL